MLLEIDRLQGKLADLSSNSSKQMHLCVIICRIGAVRQTINLALPEHHQTKLLRIITITITSAKWKNARRRKKISEHSK